MSPSQTRAPALDSAELKELKEKLLTACHILDHEGVTDGYGHVAVRVPGADAFIVPPLSFDHLARFIFSVLLGSLFFLGYFLFQLPAASLARRVGARRLITVLLIARGTCASPTRTCWNSRTAPYGTGNLWGGPPVRCDVPRRATPRRFA